jgi:hypothetical protein
MVEVFATNVHEAAEARTLVALLLQHFPDSRINFDLADCDKILRVEGTSVCPAKVMVLVAEAGFRCKALE